MSAEAHTVETTPTRQGIAQMLTRSDLRSEHERALFRNYVYAVGACAVVTAIATPLLRVFDPPNIVMLYLLTVLLIAMRWGHGPGVMSAFLSVALFDFFFVPPRFSFTVHDKQYLFTFAVMLAVAWITARLSADLQRQAFLATTRERQAHALYEMARELAGAHTLVQVDHVVNRILHNTLHTESVILELRADGTLAPASGALPSWVDTTSASLASSEASVADLASQTPTTYFPLIASGHAYGVLAVRSSDESGAILRENAELLDTTASLVSIVMERLEAPSRQKSG
jgi:two-component system sensor histidine kinase KdpD